MSIKVKEIINHVDDTKKIIKIDSDDEEGNQDLNTGEREQTYREA